MTSRWEILSGLANWEMLFRIGFDTSFSILHLFFNMHLIGVMGLSVQTDYTCILGGLDIVSLCLFFVGMGNLPDHSVVVNLKRAGVFCEVLSIWLSKQTSNEVHLK